MKSVFIIIFLICSWQNSSAQDADTTMYVYCELRAISKPLNPFAYDVSLIAVNIDEFKADPALALLLPDTKNKPAYSSMVTPLNIMASKGWRLKLRYNSILSGVNIESYILEKKVIK